MKVGDRVRLTQAHKDDLARYGYLRASDHRPAIIRSFVTSAVVGVVFDNEPMHGAGERMIHLGNIEPA